MSIIRMPHLNWPQRIAIGAALAIIGLVGGLAGPASAHTLTGGSAQATCDAGTVEVTWRFVSGDANGHHITGVQFDRRIDAIDVTTTDTTITAHTDEKAGATVELTATAIFEDGFRSSRSVTTTIPDDICPPSTTTTMAPTTVATTIPPTPLTTLPMVASSVVRSPDTTAPAVPSTGTPDRGSAPAPSGPATTVCVPTGGQLTPGARPCTLPTTGSGDVLLVLGAIAGFLVLVGLVLVTAKRVDEWKNEGGE